MDIRKHPFPLPRFCKQDEASMKMLIDLFSTDYGLMSLIVIAIVIVMWIWFTILFMGKIRLGEDTGQPGQKAVTKS